MTITATTAHATIPRVAELLLRRTTTTRVTVTTPTIIRRRTRWFSTSSSSTSSSSSTTTTTTTRESSTTSSGSSSNNIVNYYIQQVKVAGAGTAATTTRAGIGIIELNNCTKTRNALSLQLLQEFQRAIRYMEEESSKSHKSSKSKSKSKSNSTSHSKEEEEEMEDQLVDVRAVILQAAAASASSSSTTTSSSPTATTSNNNNNKVFCSGHDLNEIRTYQNMYYYKTNVNYDVNDNQAKARHYLHTLFTTCSDVMTSISQSKLPYIAKVDGIATAAGCQLVASCDLAYATKSSTFSTPGNYSIGLFCTTPAVALIHNCNLSKKVATEMLLTGQPITASTAKEIGLLNDIFDTSDELDDHVYNYIANLIANQTSYHTMTHYGKTVINTIYDTMNSYNDDDIITSLKSSSSLLEDAYKYASNIMTENSLSDDCIDGIDSFLSKKRPPSWKQPPKCKRKKSQ